MVGCLERLSTEEVGQALTGRNSRRKNRLKTLESQGEEAPVSCDLLIDKELGSFRVTRQREKVIPGGVAGQRVDFCDRVSRRIQSPHNGSHTRCCDEIHGDTILLQNAQHAYLCHPPCSSSAQHEGDVRAFQLTVESVRHAGRDRILQKGMDGKSRPQIRRLRMSSHHCAGKQYDQECEPVRHGIDNTRGV